MLVLVTGTAAAAVAAAAARKARSARLAALALTWKMSHTAADRFRLTPKVAAQFPTPGVADVVLRDLIYGPDPATGGLRYLFTVEYTTGVVRTKRRRVAVAMLVEAAAAAPVTLAPGGLSLFEQYEHLQRGAAGQLLSPTSS
jgi:hypothetical protein